MKAVWTTGSSTVGSRWRVGRSLGLTLVALCGWAGEALAQAPPIRAEGGAVLSFQGNAFRTFARFAVMDTLRVDGDAVDNPDGRRVLLYTQPFVFSYTVRPGLVLRLVAPLVWKRFEGLPDAADSEANTGLGDISLSAKYRLFFWTTADTRTDLAVLSGVKLPSGSTDATDSQGRRLPIPMQLGTGSTDYFLQVAGSFAHGARGFSAFGDVQFRRNTEGRGFRAGDVWILNLGGQKRLLPSQLEYGKPELYFELGARYVARGRAALAGRSLRDSGGEGLFLHPGLSLILKHRYLIELSFELPLLQDLNGTQLSRSWDVQLGTRVIY